jgi:hypothetical protein
LEGQPARGGADDRLEIDERARHFGRNARLPVGEEPEGQRRGDRQGRQRDGGARCDVRGQRVAERHGGDHRHDRGAGELHRGQCRGVVARQQSRRGGDERRRDDRRGEHEQIAV